VQEKKEKKGGPFVIVFLGINGTGKTTTVAKVANLLKKNGFSVVIAAADTHRAGAIEQITTHAENLSIKIISQRYGADPSAVSRDALEYAKKHYIDIVLIDTAGRMQTAKNLMYEIGKIVKVIKPDIKIFVGDSLSGNDTINQAREFFSYTEFDGAILTKSDADAKGGAAISISYITSKPILYLGMGQGYDDLVLFNREKFVNTIFNTDSLSTPPEISLTDNSKIEKNFKSYSPAEIKSVPKSNGEFDPLDDKNSIDLDKEDNIINSEEKSDIEATTNLTNQLNPQIENEDMDNSSPKLTTDSAESSVRLVEDTTNDDDDDEKIKTNAEKGSEPSRKKSLFGWFKKKNK
jgi:fused signal recognition particle receptor